MPFFTVSNVSLFVFTLYTVSINKLVLQDYFKVIILIIPNADIIITV